MFFSRTMKIRGAKSRDISQIVSLWKETGVYFEPFDKEGRLEKKIGRGAEIFLVAEDNKKIVGTVMGSYGYNASIYRLVVQTEYRGQGLTEELFKEIKNKLRKKGTTAAIIHSGLPREKWEALGCRYVGIVGTYLVEI